MIKMDRGVAPREKVVFKSDVRKLNMRTPKILSGANLASKEQKPDQSKYQYDEDVEKKLQELMSKLQGPQLTKSQVGLDAWSDVDDIPMLPRVTKRLLDNSRERQNLPRSQEKQTKLDPNSKQPFKNMPPEKSNPLANKRPASRVSGVAQMNSAGNVPAPTNRRAAVQSNHGPRAQINYPSPIKPVVRPPAPPLPNLFSKLPQNDLTGLKYKIKWGSFNRT